jgi:RsiW-degrading membrane proteinase PrsW (M82 family)
MLRVEAGYVLAPPDTTGLEPVIHGEERWWEGPAEAVGRAVREAKVDAGHVAFATRVAPGSDRWRTVVCALPALATLGLGDAPIESITPVEHGRALAVGVGPHALDGVAADRAAHAGAGAENAGARVALARGHAVLGLLSYDQALASPLVVSFGDDLVSYTRAHANKQILRSPVLPPMHRVSAAAQPPRWVVAAACALLPFALSFAWLFFVRRFDRARPEPMWLVLATFALGGLSIVPAALGEIGFSKLSPWLDPGLATLGGQAFALPLAIAVFTVVVGGVEEGSKLLGAWTLARHRREFDEPVDGIVYGCASALGFAAVENVKYFAMGRMSGVVIAMRGFMSVPAHMFFGAIWGYALGRTLVSRKARVWPFFALAALAHGTFDALLSTDGVQLLATLLVLGLAFAFIAMLQHALRHGAVPPKRGRFEEEAPPTEPLPASALPRTYFRVGSRAAFLGCAGGMILCAFSLTVLGSAYELLHHRVGIVFVVIATILLALFGLAAWGASATIPLDVALDAQGITFAGARTAWAAVLGYGVEATGTRAYVRLDTPAGPVRLGPADVETAKAIVLSIRASVAPIRASSPA